MLPLSGSPEICQSTRGNGAAVSGVIPPVPEWLAQLRWLASLASSAVVQGGEAVMEPALRVRKAPVLAALNYDVSPYVCIARWDALLDAFEPHLAECGKLDLLA